MRTELGQVITGVGQVFGFRQPERVFAPSELSPQAQEVWSVCNKWGQRAFNECKLDRMIADPYLKKLLMVGFQSTALWYEFHKQGESFGQGKSVSPEVFSEICGFFGAKKRQLAENPKLQNPNENPLIAWARVIEFQDIVVDECQKIFEKFYGCKQLWMYEFLEVREQVRESIGGVIIPKMARLIITRPPSPSA